MTQMLPIQINDLIVGTESDVCACHIFSSASVSSNIEL